MSDAVLTTCEQGVSQHLSRMHTCNECELQIAERHACHKPALGYSHLGVLQAFHCRQITQAGTMVSVISRQGSDSRTLLISTEVVSIDTFNFNKKMKFHTHCKGSLGITSSISKIKGCKYPCLRNLTNHCSVKPESRTSGSCRRCSLAGNLEASHWQECHCTQNLSEFVQTFLLSKFQYSIPMHTQLNFQTEKLCSNMEKQKEINPLPLHQPLLSHHLFPGLHLATKEKYSPASIGLRGRTSFTIQCQQCQQELEMILSELLPSIEGQTSEGNQQIKIPRQI